MKEVGGRRSLIWQRLIAAAVAAALLSALAPSLAQPYNRERMEKDIAIMENVINTAMVESELVYVFDVNTNVRGLYIPEFGALFTLQAQLTSEWASPYLTSWRYYGGMAPGSPFWTIYQMDKEKLDKLVEKLDITVNGKKVNLDEYFNYLQEYEEQREDERGLGEDIEDRRERMDKRHQLEEKKIEKKKELAEKNLQKYMQELAGIVADYGGTIRQLGDDQWIMIVAYLGSSHSHKTTTAKKVLVKAKKSDIDLYDYGKIDYEELRSRMVIEAE